jgi:hypothetical protein
MMRRYTPAPTPPLNFVLSFAGTPKEEEIPKIKAKRPHPNPSPKEGELEDCRKD